MATRREIELVSHNVLLAILRKMIQQEDVYRSVSLEPMAKTGGATQTLSTVRSIPSLMMPIISVMAVAQCNQLGEIILPSDVLLNVRSTQAPGLLLTMPI